MSNGRLNARQEKFCLLIVKGETQSRAYALAGYATKKEDVVAVNASKLLRTTKVTSRIEELHSRLRERHLIDIDFVTDELLEIVRGAKLANQWSAAAGAVATLAKMHGLVVDKAEVSVMHRPAPLPTKLLELTEDEWLKQFSNGPKRISKMDS